MTSLSPISINEFAEASRTKDTNALKKLFEGKDIDAPMEGKCSYLGDINITPLFHAILYRNNTTLSSLGSKKK